VLGPCIAVQLCIAASALVFRAVQGGEGLELDSSQAVQCSSVRTMPPCFGAGWQGPGASSMCRGWAGWQRGAQAVARAVHRPCGLSCCCETVHEWSSSHLVVELLLWTAHSGSAATGGQAAMRAVLCLTCAVPAGCEQASSIGYRW
jgi:hypothetical protein